MCPRIDQPDAIPIVPCYWLTVVGLLALSVCLFCAKYGLRNCFSKVSSTVSYLCLIYHCLYFVLVIFGTMLSLFLTGVFSGDIAVWFMNVNILPFSTCYFTCGLIYGCLYLHFNISLLSSTNNLHT